MKELITTHTSANLLFPRRSKRISDFHCTALHFTSRSTTPLGSQLPTQRLTLTPAARERKMEWELAEFMGLVGGGKGSVVTRARILSLFPSSLPHVSRLMSPLHIILPFTRVLNLCRGRRCCLSCHSQPACEPLVRFYGNGTSLHYAVTAPWIYWQQSGTPCHDLSVTASWITSIGNLNLCCPSIPLLSCESYITYCMSSVIVCPLHCK